MTQSPILHHDIRAIENPDLQPHEVNPADSEGQAPLGHACRWPSNLPMLKRAEIR